MKANATYFKRLQGFWDFNPHFRILSWLGFFKSKATLINKLLLIAFLFSQKIFGKYQMKTFIEVLTGTNQVKHTTLIKKFGLEILRSEKLFDLDANGIEVTLTGVEYFWPFTSRAITFPSMKGHVESSASRATYKMPLIGLEINCESIMEETQAYIKIYLPWFEGVFTLTPESRVILNSRNLYKN